MTTSATLNKSFGLINKVKDAEFAFDNNSENRKIFLYGDALSVSMHLKLLLRIARKLTDIGSDDYVDTFLKANSCIFMQKGQFHQLMYQAGVIYTFFYGGFG